MPNVTGGVVEHFPDNQPETYTVGATPVTGGMALEFSGNRLVIPSTAGSLKFAGIALHDGAVGDKVTVGFEGVYPLTAAGAIAAGDTLICGAAGTVAAAGAAPDARTVIGRALEAISNAAAGRCRVRA